MKPGTEIPGLDIFKDKDPPVALERSEYPEWLGDLVKPLKHLADYRKMSNEEATLDGKLILLVWTLLFVHMILLLLQCCVVLTLSLFRFVNLIDMQRYLKILRKMDIKEKNMEGKKN